MLEATAEKSEAMIPIADVPTAPELHSRVNLRQLFPQSIRLAFAESALYLVALAFVIVGYVTLATSLPPSPGGPTLIGGTEIVLRWIFYLAVTIGGGKLIYELLCFLVYRYTIELEHLTITRGILFRSRGSFPIAKINDISLHRDPVQILFGLYTLNILTASPVLTSGSIEGLPSKSAHGLQAYLLALVETTLPDVREKVAENILENSAVTEPKTEIVL